MPVPLGCHTLSVWRSATVYSDESKVQHNTTLLSLCREICLLARHLHKTVNIFNNKTSTTQWNTEIKTAQIQGKFLTIAMYTRTHGGMHAPTPPPPPPPPHIHTHTHTVSLSLSHTNTHLHTHTHTHTYKQNNNRPFHKSTNWTQKSIQMGKTDTADYGDSKLIKLFSFSYKGMILLLPSQRTIEGRQVLSSVEVAGHRHSGAVTVP